MLLWMSMLESSQISTEVKKLVSSVEVETGNKEDFLNLCKMALVDYCIQFLYHLFFFLLKGIKVGSHTQEKY